MVQRDGVQALTADEFEAFLAKPIIMFVDFWAQWCAPCRQFAHVYEQVAQKYKNIVFAAIDIEKEAALAEALHIQSVPHLMVFKEGIAIYSDSGFVPESVLHELAEQAIQADVSDILKQLAAE